MGTHRCLGRSEPSLPHASPQRCTTEQELPSFRGPESFVFWGNFTQVTLGPLPRSQESGLLPAGSLAPSSALLHPARHPALPFLAAGHSLSPEGTRTLGVRGQRPPLPVLSLGAPTPASLRLSQTFRKDLTCNFRSENTLFRTVLSLLAPISKS